MDSTNKKRVENLMPDKESEKVTHFESDFNDSQKKCKLEDDDTVLPLQNDLENISEDEFEEEFVCNDSDTDLQSDEELENEKDDERVVPWQPDIHSLNQNEELEYDSHAYDMYHRAIMDWSCLSFDIIPDSLGQNRATYPHVMYTVAGTQTETNTDNRVYVIKWKNLTGKNSIDNQDSDDSDSEEDDIKHAPIMDFRFFYHLGVVNAIRVCPQIQRLLATWSSTGKVHIWDAKEYNESLEIPGSIPNPKLESKFTFSGHKEEGFAMDFNRMKTGVFATGSRDSTVRIWRPVEGGWEVEDPITCHTDSVEAIEWKHFGSHGDTECFATGSVDRSIKIFDLKASKRVSQISIPNAHDSDVNTINWSPFQEDFLLSGGDDCCSKVWDMRNISEPIVNLKYHKQPIISVGWHPTDPATFAAASLDNSISIWDMSVEPAAGAEENFNVPDQLMFLHLGQTHISQLKWHPQIPG